MKKLLLALVMAGILSGAVYGAAASIGLTAPSVGAGDAVVGDCATSTSLTFTTALAGTPPNTSLVIDSITVDTSGSCASQSVKVFLTGSDTLSTPTELTGVLSTGDVTFSGLATNGDQVADWEDVHILITG